jgi:hypothetical protein
MNMNRSGHHEVQEPDWLYTHSRSVTDDRAKLSPHTLETAEASLQNSLTSLNLDSLTVMADFDMNAHYSVRSLPAIMHTNGGPIASTPDAPWNESPRSLRSNSRTHARSSSKKALQPPPGVSALDHLQNSISSLAAGGFLSSNGNTAPPVRNIITEEVEGTDYNSDDDGYETLEGSFGSLRVDNDTWNNAIMDTNNEMDATAHAGNVSQSHIRHSYNHNASANGNTMNYPSSPQQRSSQYRSFAAPSSPQRSIHSYYNPVSPAAAAAQQQHPPRSLHSSYSHYCNSGSGVAVRRPHALRPCAAAATTDDHHNEPSLSTLGDGGDDDNHDDDNLEIIKMLRHQVEKLKSQLLNQQQHNQVLLQQSQSNVQHPASPSNLDRFLPHDSILQRNDKETVIPLAGGAGAGVGSSTHTDYSECDSFGGDVSHDNDHSNTSSRSMEEDIPKSNVSSSPVLLEAQSAMFGAIAALKASFHQQQQQHALQSSPQYPVVTAAATPEQEDDASSEQWLLNELVVCELEAHCKALLRAVSASHASLQAQNQKLRHRVALQAARLAELEPGEAVTKTDQ